MRLLALPVALTAFLSPLSAQGGPWKDGELIVRSQIEGTQIEVLYRIEPETGHGEELFSGFYWGGWAGSYVFDPYRGGLLTCMGLPPSIFFQELYLVDENGVPTLIPGFTQVMLRAMAPAPDGRVYLQEHFTDVIQYLDANDQIHTLMDASGTAPFSFSAEHLLYHAPTNSLLATTSPFWTPGNLCVPNQSSIFRIPLSADGSRAVGPVICGSAAGVSNNIMSMDYLPGGDLLVLLEGSQFFNETMRRIDPITLTSTVFGAPQQADVNGLVWSARIGKAVLLDDSANELRLFSPGEVGSGTLLPSDVSVSPSTTGFAPVETLVELDLFGPGCAGVGLAFGNGLAGTGGLVPTMNASGCPDLGNPIAIEIDNVLSNGFGGLVVGFTQTALPLFGGTFYVLPAQTLPVSVNGAGSVSLPITFTSPGLVGTSLFVQAGFVDPAAIEGVSLTNALQLSIG